MKQGSGVMMALVVALSGTARADEAAPPPDRAKPFLTEDDSHVVTVTGAFGPARDTMMVFAYHGLEGMGRFVGFALVSDDKAKHGQRKIELPALPQGSDSGEVAVTLVANLDRDADDEIVVGFRVFRTVRGRQGGFSYNTWEYAVLDWNGKKFVRLPALEKKLQARADAREEHKGSVLSEDDARAALGVAKK
ncbi:MAG TPA: hypothetical protein VF516_22775 [Kofleriaceae bacterium]